MKSMNPGAATCQFSLLKGPQRYIVRCTAGDEQEAIDRLMLWAEDPDLDFDWFDAAVLSRQVNQELIHRLCRSRDAEDEN